MRITVTGISMAGSIAYGYGRSDDGRQVRFAGDWRPMRDIDRALKAGEEVEVEVEDWQVLSATSPHRTEDPSS